jgi:inner membrane protein
MFIAHLPVGYLVVTVAYQRVSSLGLKSRGYFTAGMLGAVAPDTDLIYFYLIDHRQHNHHSYWTHYPSVWLVLFLISLVLYLYKRSCAFCAVGMVFSVNGLIHMVLDSVAGYIHWFAPVGYHAYGLVTLTRKYEIWWLNYILHWTFLIELSLAVWAILVLRRNLRVGSSCIRPGARKAC